MTAVSVAVGAAVAPLVAYHFHVVTPASVLLTPLASPLVGLAIAAGLAAVTVGWLVPPLGSACGAVCGGVAACRPSSWCRAPQDVPGAFSYCCEPRRLVAVRALRRRRALMAAVPALRPHWRWQASLAMLWAAVGFASLDAGRTRARASCAARFSPWATARARCSSCPAGKRFSTTPAAWARRSTPRKSSPSLLVGARHQPHRRHRACRMPTSITTTACRDCSSDFRWASFTSRR